MNVNVNMIIFWKALLFFLLIDLPVILYLNRDMYASMFAIINQGKKVDSTVIAWTGVWVYLAMALSVTLFARDWKSGALLGFCILSVYNFTNAATIARYSTRTAMLDTLWGTTLFATVSYLVYHK